VENNTAVIEHATKAYGSSGVHGTEGAVKAYDPTGLRSAMTASHQETYKSVMKHMPTHLVRMAWGQHIDEVVSCMESNGLPPIPGLNSPHIVKAGIMVAPDQQF
jgi:putative heme iron utilization protein